MFKMLDELRCSLPRAGTTSSQRGSCWTSCWCWSSWFTSTGGTAKVIPSLSPLSPLQCRAYCSWARGSTSVSCLQLKDLGVHSNVVSGGRPNKLRFGISAALAFHCYRYNLHFPQDVTWQEWLPVCKSAGSNILTLKHWRCTADNYEAASTL